MFRAQRTVLIRSGNAIRASAASVSSAAAASRASSSSYQPPASTATTSSSMDREQESILHPASSSPTAKTQQTTKEEARPNLHYVAHPHLHHHHSTPVVQRRRHWSPDSLPADDHQWQDVLSTLGTLGRTSQGNKITPYYASEDAYTHMWKAIDEATTRIVWQTYICKDDVVGNKTIDKLVQAQKRGVDVTLLYDDAGNISGRERLVSKLRDMGGTVIHYKPVFRNMVPYIVRGMPWRRSPGLRNHRKILVVDSKIAFTGGLNIGDDYAGKQVGGNGRFRDTHCAIEGPAVQDVEDVCRDTVDPQRVPTSMRWRQWASAVMNSKRLAFQRGVTSTSRKVSKRFRQVRGKTTNLTAAIHTIRARMQAERMRVQQMMAMARARLRNNTKALQKKEEATGPGDQDPKMMQQHQSTEAVTTATSTANRGRKRRTKRPQDRLRAVVRSKIEQMETAMMNRVNRARCRLLGLKTRRNIEVQRQAASSDTTHVAAAAASGQDLSKVEPHQTHTTMKHKDNVSNSGSSHHQVLICNPHTRNWGIQKALWLVTRRAQKKIWITTPYFVPHLKLTREVISAAKRGVEVRVVTGAQATTDPWFMWYAQQYLTHRLLKAGVKLYEYEETGCIMHAKTVVVDGRWASIGSYNWDILSNKLMEVCMTGYDQTYAAEMERHFEKDVSKSKRITEDLFLARPLYVKVACVFLYHALKVAERVSFWSYQDPDLISRLE